MNRIMTQSLMTVGIALAVAAPVFAQNTEFTLNGSGAGNWSAVTISAPGLQNFYAAVGTYQAAIGSTPANTKTYNVFCVDPNDEIDWGTSYPADVNEAVNAPGVSGPSPFSTPGVNGGTSFYYTGGMASALNTTDLDRAGLPTDANPQEVADEVGYLASTFLNDSNTTDVTAAQLAIWSVIDNGPTGVGTAFSFDDPSVSGLVSTDISNAAGAATSDPNTLYGNVSWVQAPIAETDGGLSHTQDFVYEPNPDLTPTPGGLVPTPETSSIVPFMILAAGGACFLIAKRRKSQAS